MSARKSTQVPVHGDHITLGQLLHTAGVVQTGGEARWYLSEHTVLVNGEPEQRRGRKLRPGDRVEVAGFGTVDLVAQGPDAGPPP